MDDRITATRVSYFLDISVVTLGNWYKWYNDPKYDKPEDMPELPPYEQKSPRGTRYWKRSDLPKLLIFKYWLPRGGAGIMGDFNARFWGDRGKRALKNKGIDGKVYKKEN